MKYTLIGPCKYGEKPFPIPFEKIKFVHHGTFGCFDNFNNVLIAVYDADDNWGGQTERLKIIGHFEFGITTPWWAKLSGIKPTGIIRNFNSEWREEDVTKLLKMGAKLPDPYCK